MLCLLSLYLQGQLDRIRFFLDGKFRIWILIFLKGRMQREYSLWSDPDRGQIQSIRHPAALIYPDNIYVCNYHIDFYAGRKKVER